VKQVLRISEMVRNLIRKISAGIDGGSDSDQRALQPTIVEKAIRKYIVTQQIK
jgi:hypothetical protein